MIGQNIKTRRNKLGMSQDELARKLGYKSRSSVQKIEKGKNDMPHSKVKSFAEALDTTPEYLMGWIPLPDKKENELVSAYRNLNMEGKSILLGLLKSLSHTYPASTAAM